MAPVHGQHTGFPYRVPRLAAPAASVRCDLFDASRPPFVGPSASRLRGHAPRLAPSLNGFPAVPWILGPRQRSRTLSAALAALRSVSGSRLPRPVQGVRRSPLQVPWAFPVCAGAPDARKDCSCFLRESSRANQFSTTWRITWSNEIAQQNRAPFTGRA